MTFAKMCFYDFLAIILMLNAYEGAGLYSAFLWMTGGMAVLVSGMYFWELRDSEDFKRYVKNNINWRIVGVMGFWVMVFLGGLLALLGWVG